MPNDHPIDTIAEQQKEIARLAAELAALKEQRRATSEAFKLLMALLTDGP
jgi:uncharacterized small protein (DUF1192 family)